MNIELFILILTLFATATLAISAVFQSARQGYDIFGALVLALVTALGGGTLRDLLLGAEVFWVDDHQYIVVILLSVIFSILTINFIPKGKGIRLKVLEYMDAVGLALFTVLGVQKSLSFDTHPMIAVLMGVITGVVGGIGRDVLSNVQPSVLKTDVYATLSLIGGIIYILIIPFSEQKLAMLFVFGIIVICRILVLIFNLKLPKLSSIN